MWLTDAAIAEAVSQGEVVITPFVQEMSRPASHLLTLSDRVVRTRASYQPIDVFSRESVQQAFMPVERVSPILLAPGEFALAATRECVGLSPMHLGRLTGMSHLARLGLIVHVTADLVSPGFGWDVPTAITLELVNHHARPLMLHPGMPICHLMVGQMALPARQPYHWLGVRYGGSEEPTVSRYPDEFGSGKGVSRTAG
ncbi:dCTP deaminase [Nocardia beijingensis]|uniref:dCTP deaminase n=1 Tax=Nocardia beijingensis TaxID=95162 RepID=UPI00344D69B3